MSLDDKEARETDISYRIERGKVIRRWLQERRDREGKLYAADTHLPELCEDLARRLDELNR